MWLSVWRAGGFLLSARVPRIREGYYNSVRSLFNKIVLGEHDVIPLRGWELAGERRKSLCCGYM